MTHAALTGTTYHLWWHPHNFGTGLDDNIQFLSTILEHYRRLAKTHGMIARNMGEIAEAEHAEAAPAASGRAFAPPAGRLAGQSIGR
jgi:hypothetical protein